MSKKVSAQVAQKANAKKQAVLDDLAKKEQEEQARQAQLAEAAAEEAVAEEVAQDEQAVEAAQTIAAAAETLDASAQEVAAVIADSPLMFAQAGAAATGGGAAAGGISTAAIVAGVAVVGVAAAASSSSDSPAATAPAPGTPDPTPPGVTPTPTALTTGTDTIVGTAAAEAWSGAVSVSSAQRTLNDTDMIDGGDGADSLTLDVYSNFSGFAATGYIKNIETITLENKGTSARDFAAKNVTGVTEYILKGNMTLSQLADTDAKISIVDRATGTTTIAFATASGVATATDDALTVSLSNVGKDKDNRVTVTAADIETLSFAVDGDNFVALGSNSASALTVTGAGTFNLNAVSTGLKTVDANAATGNVTLDLTAVTTAKQISSISTGSGSDSVKVDVADMYGFATVIGGEGSDTLELATGSTTAVQFDMSGVENLQLNALTNGLTFSTASTAGLEKIIVDKTGTAVTAKFIQMGASDIVVESRGASAGATAVDLDTTGAVTLNITTPASGATTTTPDTNARTLTANNASSVEVNVDTKMSFSGSVTANTAESIVVKNSGEVTGGTITASKATALYITNTANADSDTTIATAALELLDITSTKGLAITGNVTAQVVTADTTKLLGLGALTKAESVVLSGAGSVNIAAITGNTSSTVEVTASELESNAGTGTNSLYIASVTTTGQDILLDVSEVKGAVEVNGAITTGGTDGDVTIDATKTGGLLTLAAITAENVTITATNSLAGVAAGGTITVEETIVYNGSGSTANTATAADGGAAVDINAAAAAITATLNGGLDVDKFDITTADGTDTVKVTVKGDLGAAGADVVTIDVKAEALAVTIDTTGLTANSAATINITGTDAADTIKLSNTASETVITTATSLATVDTITNFDGGTGGDVLQLSVTALETLVTDLVDGAVASVAHTDTVAINEINGAETLAAGDHILVITGQTFSTAALMGASLEAGGANALTFANAPTAADGLIVLWSDGTDAYLSTIATGSTAAAVPAAALTETDFMKLSGISAIASGDFVATNFDFIA